MSEFEQKIVRTLAVIEHRLTGIEKHLSQLNGDTKDNRTEISKLKMWRWFITGGLALLGIMIPVFLVLLQFLAR